MEQRGGGGGRMLQINKYGLLGIESRAHLKSIYDNVLW